MLLTSWRHVHVFAPKAGRYWANGWMWPMSFNNDPLWSMDLSWCHGLPWTHVTQTNRFSQIILRVVSEQPYFRTLEVHNMLHLGRYLYIVFIYIYSVYIYIREYVCFKFWVDANLKVIACCIRIDVRKSCPESFLFVHRMGKGRPTWRAQVSVQVGGGVLRCTNKKPVICTVLDGSGLACYQYRPC